MIKVKYLPANCAYMILWHEQRIAGPMPRGDAQRFMQDFYPELKWNTVHA
jgi:hypothetical protein